MIMMFMMVIVMGSFDYDCLVGGTPNAAPVFSASAVS